MSSFGMVHKKGELNYFDNFFSFLILFIIKKLTHFAVRKLISNGEIDRKDITPLSKISLTC